MNPKHQKEIQNIMNCFTGADGGVDFIKLRCSIERWEEEDGHASNQLLEMISNFSKLINVCCGRPAE